MYAAISVSCMRQYCFFPNTYIDMTLDDVRQLSPVYLLQEMGGELINFVLLSVSDQKMIS